jgi:hypothetical protein
MDRLSTKPGLHVIPLGVTGGMQQALGPTLLQLGVEWKDLARVRRDLHGSALCHTHRLILHAGRSRRAAASAAGRARGGTEAAAAGASVVLHA